MLNLNRVELIGRLGRDPEIRFTQDGKKVASVSLATTERWKDRNGQRHEDTEWHRLVAWGKLAELFEKHTATGDYLRVIGALRTRKWTDQQNVERYTTEIVVHEIGFLEPKDRADDTGGYEPGADEIPH